MDKHLYFDTSHTLVGHQVVNQDLLTSCQQQDFHLEVPINTDEEG
jgi:hypothetical protein